VRPMRHRRPYEVGPPLGLSRTTWTRIVVLEPWTVFLLVGGALIPVAFVIVLIRGR
jgi:hypothetical protein